VAASSKCMATVTFHIKKAYKSSRNLFTRRICYSPNLYINQLRSFVLFGAGKGANF